MSSLEHFGAKIFKAGPRARVGPPQTSLSPPPVILLLTVPRRLFCFGSLVILDVVCRYLLLFLLYINTRGPRGPESLT